MENTFKSSVFGGFNRDDVIRYIEKTSLESKQQIEALEQESDGLCRENAELRDKLAAAERERDKFAESYSTASSAQDALKKGLTAAQETISELRAQIEEGAQKLASAKADCDRQLKAKEEAAEQRIAELEAQHAERLSAAEQERKRLLSELDELRPQVEEYGRGKAHIAGIELSARERADALDAATRERLQAMIAACRGHCEQVLSTLGATCESVSNELQRAAAYAAEHYAAKFVPDCDVVIANNSFKPAEANCAYTPEVIASLKDGGSFVLAANSPFGPCVHFLYDKWGHSAPGGMMWSGCYTKGKNMAHAVVFAEHTVKGMRDPWYIDEHSGAEYVKTWSDALRILDDGTPKKVVLYPNAECQVLDNSKQFYKQGK